MCSVKKVFLEILQNSQESTSARDYCLIKLQTEVCIFIKKETLAHVFSYKFCEISKDIYCLWQSFKCNLLKISWPEDNVALREKCPYWSFSCPYFPAFGLNMNRYSVSLRIQSDWKYGPETPNTETFTQCTTEKVDIPCRHFFKNFVRYYL